MADPKDDDRSQAHPALRPGTAAGRYRIVEEIGAGGTGDVYLAEDTELNRSVALKFLPPNLCQDETSRARFKREAQAAARLDHPNIVAVYEVGEFRGRPFFAMEYVYGRPLKDFVADGPVSLDFAIDTALQVCDGLGRAHREGVIHRDIKPSNIIIDTDRRARLVDFGLASGTIAYMSPEQVKGKDIDRRSDLFSLGVVLYEMIAGRRPFERDSEAATMNAILADKPEPLARYKSDVPADLERIVGRLLAKDVAYRYQSAEGVLSDLGKFADAGLTKAHTPVDWWNRYVVVGAAIILAIIAVLWLLGKLSGTR